MSVPRWPAVFLGLALAIAACGGDQNQASPDPTTVVAEAVDSIPRRTAPSSDDEIGQPSATATTAATVTPSARATATADSSSSPSTSTPSATTTASTTGPATSSSSSSSSSSTTSTAGGPDPTTPGLIRLRLDRRVDDAATEGFAPMVRAVLTDGRGWTNAGFEFVFDDGDGSDETAFDYTVVLAEGSEVDQLCLPYDTFGRFSCQIGPVVALNADRWRTAVDGWPATLDDYRTMLVNHEVGHLLGQHHPASRCRDDGLPAPVMAQQSSGVAPCTANPWPLPWEITCAGLGLEPLAPPFERDITLTCGPDGPIG